MFYVCIHPSVCHPDQNTEHSHHPKLPQAVPVNKNTRPQRYHHLTTVTTVVLTIPQFHINRLMERVLFWSGFFRSLFLHFAHGVPCISGFFLYWVLCHCTKSYFIWNRTEKSLRSTWSLSEFIFYSICVISTTYITKPRHRRNTTLLSITVLTLPSCPSLH